ncbi:MAG: DUF3800 domain-containing protein [Pseudomonadota bacterium]
MPKPFEKYYLFCDESSTVDQFTVIGATMMHDDVVARAEAAIEKIVQKHGGTSEMKWTKVKKHNLPLYKEASKLFFDAIAHELFTFTALVVDNSKMDHKTYNEGNKEIGFNKMLFQLLFSFARKYRSQPRFYVFLDARKTKHSPESLRLMLNGKAARDLNVTHRPFRRCDFHDSRSFRLIQITDVIIGAIGFHSNDKHIRVGAAPYKIELADYIASLAGMTRLYLATPPNNNGFDIWLFDFSKAKRPRRPRP